MDLDQAPVVECVAQAASHYGADASRVLATFKSREGKHGEIRVLPNGDVEIGLAAIPAKEIPALAGHGVTAEKLQSDACLNVAIGTYLLRRDEILRSNDAVPDVVAAPTPIVANTSKPGRSQHKPSRAVAGAEVCVQAAASRYHLPLPVFQAVLTTEGGWDGLRKKNTNGSFDLGRAQINTIHLPELAKFGISEESLVNDACTNLHVAAYRLRYEINRAEDFWRGVGNYHSRTPHLNKAYRERVVRNLQRILNSNS